MSDEAEKVQAELSRRNGAIVMRWMEEISARMNAMTDTMSAMQRENISLRQQLEMMRGQMQVLQAARFGAGPSVRG